MPVTAEPAGLAHPAPHLATSGLPTLWVCAAPRRYAILDMRESAFPLYSPPLLTVWMPSKRTHLEYLSYGPTQ